MSISNKLNIILLLTLIFSVSIGCNLLDSKSSKEIRRSDPASAGDTTDDADSTDDDSSDDSSSTDTTQKSKSNNSTTTVKFSKGKTSGTYPNKISKGDKQTYILNASAGQELSISTISNEGLPLLRVYDPSGTDINGGTVQNLTDEPLSKSGNYKIVVTTDTAKKFEYDIVFEVKGGGSTSPGTTPVPSSLRKTVKFGKGKSSASYSNILKSGSNHTYVVGASAGQTLNVTISGGAEFGIYGPGSTLTKVSTSYNGPLPDNGNYEIEVFGSPGTYTLNISVY